MINKVLELYPYSFDMLRGENIKIEYYVEAANSGYLFSNLEIDSIKNKCFNIQLDILKKYTISSYSYSIYNDICLKPIPYQDRLKYLITTNSLYNEYKKVSL